MSGHTLRLFPGRYAACRMDPQAAVPPWAEGGGFVSITRTPDELSIVCPEEAVPPRASAERGCAVTVFPAGTSAQEILDHRFDGVFLSNGPGDPEAVTGAYPGLDFDQTAEPSRWLTFLVERIKKRVEKA